ncbi:hypothetical protein OEZ86_000939 [Tetradesmus obliquus]|nr:hypothetical protein OEZ86_000939 [Tetradesmus obliquus]
MQANGGLDAASSSSTAAAGVTAQLELVAEGYQLYLGETCVFYFTLSNQGGTPVSQLSIKVECAVEGGSKGVLYDNAASPLPRLPASGRHDVIVTTDIKEQGQVELVASAVFTDHMAVQQQQQQDQQQRWRQQQH